MLNGIGGRTVAEAKERLSAEEAWQWSAYLERRGSIHPGMRLEWGFALIAMMINRALGGKAELGDYMPHAHDPQEPASLAEAMKILSGKK